ncbi:hypothetical protein MPTK1_2g24195 [Marchantia polymorpha subsp. ruderalis]
MRGSTDGAKKKKKKEGRNETEEEEEKEQVYERTRKIGQLFKPQSFQCCVSPFSCRLEVLWIITVVLPCVELSYPWHIRQDEHRTETAGILLFEQWMGGGGGGGWMDGWRERWVDVEDHRDHIIWMMSPQSSYLFSKVWLDVPTVPSI